MYGTVVKFEVKQQELLEMQQCIIVRGGELYAKVWEGCKYACF